MERQAIINRVINAINRLPEDKANTIADFAEFLGQRYSTQDLQSDIQNSILASDTFNFLDNEDDLYNSKDI